MLQPRVDKQVSKFLTEVITAKSQHNNLQKRR